MSAARQAVPNETRVFVYKGFTASAPDRARVVAPVRYTPTQAVVLETVRAETGPQLNKGARFRKTGMPLNRASRWRMLVEE